jgi:hypothetical protein
MPIQHKFLNYDWGNGFYTRNTILHNKTYDPEILFIGTFNPNWPWNDADFFYGRGMYMWTILGNFFLNNANVLTAHRTPPPMGNNIPTLAQIFEICIKGKISFADIVLGTKPNIPTDVYEDNEAVKVNNGYKWTGYKDKSIDFLGVNNWLNSNVNNIIKFINATPSLKYIHFTFKTGTWLITEKNAIIAGIRPVTTINTIFTPTGMGFRKNLSAPFGHRAWSLAHCWVWNGLIHAIPVNKIGYGHLNHAWLIAHGVNPAIF